MDMQTEVCLQSLQTREQCPIGVAGIRGRLIIRRQPADPLQGFIDIAVFVFHDRNRLVKTNIGTDWCGRFVTLTCFQSLDRRKKHVLLLEHVIR